MVVESIQGCGSCHHCEYGAQFACANRKEVGVLGRNGAFAQYVSVPVRFVHKLPAGFDMKKAVCCEPLSVILKALDRIEGITNRNVCEAVLVMGGGPIGNLCAQILELRGHSVVVYDQDLRRRQHFQGGAIKTTGDLCDSENYRVLIDATGDPDVLRWALEKSRTGATLLLLGLSYSRHRLNMEQFISHDKTIVGSMGSSADDFEQAIKLLPELYLEPFIQMVLPLSEFDTGLQMFKNREYLKVLLEIP